MSGESVLQTILVPTVAAVLACAVSLILWRRSAARVERSPARAEAPGPSVARRWRAALVACAFLAITGVSVLRLVAAPDGRHAADPCAFARTFLEALQSHDYLAVWQLTDPEARLPRPESVRHAHQAMDGVALTVTTAPRIVAKSADTALVRVNVVLTPRHGKGLPMEWEMQLVRRSRGWRLANTETVESSTARVPYPDAAAAMSVVAQACEAWRQARWEDFHQLVSPAARPATLDAFLKSPKCWPSQAPRAIRVLKVCVPDVLVGTDVATARRAMVDVYVQCWNGHGPGVCDAAYTVFVEKLDRRWYLASASFEAFPKWCRQFRGPKRKMLPDEAPARHATPPAEVVRQYLQDWVRGCYEDMYALLSQSVRDGQAVYPGALARAVFCDCKRSLEQEGGKVVAFGQISVRPLGESLATVTTSVTVNRANPGAGLADGSRRFYLTVEGGHWRIANDDGIERHWQAPATRQDSRGRKAGG